jgi:hypothetical protein
MTKTEAEAKAGEHLAADGDAEVSRIPEFVDVGIGLVRRVHRLQRDR